MSEWFIKNRISDEDFIKICNESITMAIACAELKLHFNSFKKRAIELKCYNTNPGGRGTNKKNPEIPIEDIIFKNKHPQYQTFKLKNRLIKCGLKENKCEICQINEWCNKIINIELDHIDGNKYNHQLNNLRMLCPNCHSQTNTYRSKNKNYIIE